MERKEGFYWVNGFKWSDNPRWIIAEWNLGSWWFDGDDYGDESFLEIDERIIERTPLQQEHDNNCSLCHGFGEYHIGGSFGGAIQIIKCDCKNKEENNWISIMDLQNPIPENKQNIEIMFEDGTILNYYNNNWSKYDLTHWRYKNKT